MIKTLLVLFMLLCTASASAQTVIVANDVQTIPRKAGEAQSTVVPPGKKRLCRNGRFLVSRDELQPPAKGLVIGRNLDDPNAPLVEATFDLPPHPKNYAYKTSDHDLIALDNGDVLYLTGAFTRAPLSPQPAWFDVTFRDDFGPGARSNLMVWRSTDCGQTFQYLSQFDPALFESGVCALPQFPRLTTGHGSPEKPIFDAGGSDGQLVKRDAATDTLYLTFQCVGYLPDEAQTRRLKHFELSQTTVNRTLVAASFDKGASWQNLGVINKANWRFGVVPLENGNLAFGLSNMLTFAKRDAAGKYAFDATGVPVPDSAWGWDEATFYQNQHIPTDLIHANMWAHTITARHQATNNLVTLAFPSSIESGAKGHGYRLLTYNRVHNRYDEFLPLKPQKATPDNFLFHLAAIDLGAGPVLLYWYDFDSASRTATVRGRLIRGPAQFWLEFDISLAGGQPRSFSLDSTVEQKYWYGDYLTAGGYVVPPKQPQSNEPARYVFYPMWVEPDGTIRYTTVTFIEGAAKAAAPLTAANAPRTLRPPTPVALTSVRPSAREIEEVQEYGRRKRENRTGDPRRGL